MSMTTSANEEGKMSQNAESPHWWEQPGIGQSEPTGAAKRPAVALNFWFEWSVGTPLWPQNDAAYTRFGVGPIALKRLPLSDATRQWAQTVCDWHDDALNWDDPGGPSLWRQSECDHFNGEAQRLYETIAWELSEATEAYEVINAHKPLREDPRLDAYLEGRHEPQPHLKWAGAKRHKRP